MDINVPVTLGSKMNVPASSSLPADNFGNTFLPGNSFERDAQF
jgi:hypothetical protein